MTSADDERHPLLIDFSDAYLDAPKCMTNLEVFQDVMKRPGAPSPVGRHKESGLLYRRDELLAWLKTQKP